MVLEEILDKLQPFPIWDGVEEAAEAIGVNKNLQGWIIDYRWFHHWMKELNPKLIIEVGAWKGLSTVIFGQYIESHDMDTRIICVDTWLGSAEHWNDGETLLPFMEHGYPIGLYYQFLMNIAYYQLGHLVYPFPQTSRGAAEWFRMNGVTSKLIYVDASHQYEDVVLDLADYWGLLEPGGVMFGDDYGGHWTGVTQAVDEFEKAHPEASRHCQDTHMWAFMKPNE